MQDVIDRHSYTPNALARFLIQNSTKTIGVLTTEITDPYYARVVYIVEQQLKALGYDTFLCNTGKDPESKSQYIHALLEKKVDGLIFVGSVYREKEDSKRIKEVSSKLPVVLINNHINHENIYCVVCDDEKGMFDAYVYLAGQGAKEIVYIHKPNTFSALKKRNGFIKAAGTRQLPGAAYRIINVPEDTWNIKKPLREEFCRKPFDAVLCCEDIYANQAATLLQEMGISIPGQVRVMGYNDSVICGYTYPELSTVDSLMDVMGMEGAQLIHNVLKGNIPKKKVNILTPSLVIRSSG